MNDIAFKVIIKNDGIDDVIFKTLMLKGEKGDKGDAGGADIDDSTTSSTKTWSSNKIRAEIDAKPDNLSELDDVDLDSISDEQLLGYNFTTGKWENKSVDASTLKYDANTSIKEKIDDKANTADLATVATSGEYNDLSNKPQLASVATSGDYDDLINKPTIPPAQVNADWNASSGVAEILNKPTIPVVDQTLNSGSSNAISNSAVVNGLSGKADISITCKMVQTTLTFNSTLNRFTLPSGTPLPAQPQQCLVARNSSTGAIYALWYVSTDQNFQIGATLSGTAPSNNQTCYINYTVPNT